MRSRTYPRRPTPCAVYEIETALDLEAVAAVMAGEQSCGTFVRVARETDELRARHAATVAAIEELPPSGRAPLPGAAGDWRSPRRARVSVDFPLRNFGPSLPYCGPGPARRRRRQPLRAT